MPDPNPMSAPPIPAEVAAPTTCASCQQPLAEQHYRVGTRPICLACAPTIYALQQRNRFAAGPWIVGAVVGIIVALLCGVAWAAIVYATGYEIGYAAIGVGFVVSAAVVKATGGRRGKSIQVITIGCSVLGVIAGRGFYVVWMELHNPAFNEADPLRRALALVIWFVSAPVITFGALDILWYLIAIRVAWRAAKAPPIQLHGPYPTVVPPPPQGMQFDVVQPMNPPSNGSQVQT